MSLTSKSKTLSLGRTIRLGAAISGLLLSAMMQSVAFAGDQSVNINTATPEVLSDGLSGVGIAKAYRIVEYREAHGPFEAIEELSEVNGIGDAIVERNREKIVLR